MPPSLNQSMSEVSGDSSVPLSGSSSSSNDGLPVADMSESADRIINELRWTALEKEPFTGTDQQIIGYQLTYKAVLARHGYLVRNTLGTGSYSKVKRALSFKSKRVQLAAVKIIDKQKAPRDYQEKFMPRELKLWPKLKHPHLVSLLEYFEDNRRVYMVLEYADGGDALRYIQEHGAVSEETARRWIAQIGDAIFYMHRRQIAHRDLKLENLLLDWENNIKLCDFGFVREVHSKQELSQTYCGSKSYAAPEILKGMPYDPMKSDVWALGVILYILITGKMPFDETKGRRSILEEQKLLNFDWATCKRHVSMDCRELIHRMLTWEFQERPGVDFVLVDKWFITETMTGSVTSKSDPGFQTQGSGKSNSKIAKI